MILTIGIANDLPMAAEALRRCIVLRKDFQVLWIARDGGEAVKLAAEQRADLILMDLIMPNMNGAEATRQIMAATPCAILIVTSNVGTNADRVFEAMGYGALDAVDTPELGSARGITLLLEKIDGIRHKLNAGLFRARNFEPNNVGPDAAYASSPAQPARALREPSISTSHSAHGHDSNFGRTQLQTDFFRHGFDAAPEPYRPGQADYPLVAIGASAGGPAALGKLLSALPADFPAALVLVQHVDAQFAQSMAAWLNVKSQLPVRIAEDGEAPAPRTVLLAGTSDHLKLRTTGRLGYSSTPAGLAYRPSVDVFFHSVCRYWNGEAIGVLLTGMGRDGAEGLKAMREQGWTTIAQDEASCAVYGMPKAAAALDAASHILPLDGIGEKLKALIQISHGNHR